MSDEEFNRIVEQYADTVYRVALSYAKSPYDAEDVVQTTFMNLPPKCRIVVHLFYYEEYSSKEIAELLHLREATVRTRLVRARKLLRQQLKEAWEDEE